MRFRHVAYLTFAFIFTTTAPSRGEIIKFSTASDSGNTAPLWIAADLGFFQKYGNTVRLEFIQGAEVLEENFRAYDHNLRPYATDEMLELPLQEVTKSEPRATKAKPAQFVDHTILKELESSGFIENVATQYGLK
jgi:hypothetical protein